MQHDKISDEELYNEMEYLSSCRKALIDVGAYLMESEVQAKVSLLEANAFLKEVIQADGDHSASAKIFKLTIIGIETYLELIAGAGNTIATSLRDSRFARKAGLN